MRILLYGFLSLVCLIFIDGCSRESGPQVRIKNEQMNKVEVKIQTSEAGKTVKMEVDQEHTTDFQTAAEGNVTVTSLTQNESVSFLAEKNAKYTIVLSTGAPLSVLTEK